MASNPMQRKSRNSFLLGIIVTLLITGVVIAMLLLMLKQKNDDLNAELAAKQEVYTLTQNVKAGQILTKDMFKNIAIHKDSIPSNATSVSGVIDSWYLQTKEGEPVQTDQYGLYLDRTIGSDTIIEIITNTGDTFEDNEGKKVQNGDLYVDVGGIRKKVSTTDADKAQKDEHGMYFVDSQKNDKKTRVYQEGLTDEFYIFKIDTTSMNLGDSKVRVKEYIDIKNVPVIAKVDMNANTVITSKLVVQSSEIVTDDTRQEEYNMITLPIDLMTNDYIDIRLKLPSGQNFIVISKAQVEVPMNADGTYIVDTIKVNLREDEILAMSSAIVEAYGINGAELYATKYVDPAMQAAAIPDYTPNAAVKDQLDRDGDNKLDNPNIVEQAMNELYARYSDALKKVRSENLNQVINNMDFEEYNSNISSGVEDSMGSSLTSRKQYLESLGY